MKSVCHKSIVLGVLFIVTGGGALWAADASLTLCEFSQDFNKRRIHTTDARYVLRSDSLDVTTGHAKKWPGIRITAPGGAWDLSSFWYVTVSVENLTEDVFSLACRVDNPGADGKNNCVTGYAELQPSQVTQLHVPFHKTPWALSAPLELVGMRGYPEHNGKVKPANITQILLFTMSPKQDYCFRVREIVAAGQCKPLDALRFEPFIDMFGQFRHDQWPGKTQSEEELQRSFVLVEEQDLLDHPGPADRNGYGGWTAGPRLEGTGFFRVAKHEEKWWLVDPEGYLFWSHGMDCVNLSAWTPISDREHYFKWLPAESDPLAQFYGTGSWAPHGYYKDKTPYRTFDFFKANLYRVHGPKYQDWFSQLTHRRLKSWGLNTIGNWSDSKIFLQQKTPYTRDVSFDAPVIEGSEGYWGKFFDVFDPAFRENFKKRLNSIKNTSAKDPWCIGYFVHNEIAWGDELSLALATLSSPAEQKAKQAFVEVLRRKYRVISGLNKVWGTKHASWDALLRSTRAPDQKKAYDDLADFYDRIADTYFRIIHDELKAVVPNQLYLGCRFAWVNDRAARAAARYCDVVCYNKYVYSVADLCLPGKIDKPIIIGEFHFGALDRGMFHTGLKSTSSQAERADAYRSYVRSALANPFIVGTHWFQYKDQATTGRGDGENYQIGFVDICNRPYPEIVEAAREVAETMYQDRLGK